MMAKNRSIFQIIIFIVFAAFIVVAVFVFAGLSTGGGGQSVGRVTMWGSFDREVIDSYLRRLNDENSDVGGIVYEEIPKDQFQPRLVEALANGTGPDLFILDQSLVVRHRDKIQPLSYERMDRREFRDTFVDEGEMFLGDNGILAIPFSIDPMVLYWNRDIFAEAGFAEPPEHWDELFLLATRITERDQANNINRATIAFGEYSNVDHTKDIISMLIMQAGGRIVGARDGVLEAELADERGFASLDNNINPTQSAVRFYTVFADPIKNVYSWNRSLPRSLEMFAQGKLALYVGYASEVDTILEKNPNLNFDVAPMPQIRAGEQKKTMTFGTMYALAVPRTATNQFGGAEMAFFLTDALASEMFADAIGTPSPRRDILRTEPDDPLKLVFRNAALISRAWFDPQPSETNKIFRRMIGDVTSGSLRISDAIQRADRELSALVGNP